jgi:hypothetical protein
LDSADSCRIILGQPFGAAFFMKGIAHWFGRDEESLPRAFVFVVWSYWALFSLATPVTVWDANVYNLARLELARLAGLFGNPYWNAAPQAYLPWTFDAVHLPFLRLGFGMALPSFACLTGLLAIVFEMTAARFGRAVAWWCCAGLLALPTVMYQATSTKNDIVVVFALACWVCALDRYRVQPRRRFLILMALSLAFASGAKTSGLIFTCLLAPWTVWVLRRSKGSLAVFVVAFLICFAGWGSIEVYANNLRLYGRLLAPQSYFDGLRNRDGLSGALANFIRYLVGNTNLVIDGLHPSPALLKRWDAACRAVLGFCGLKDAGYALDYNDSRLHFWKDGWEASSDFGPLGAAALWFSIFAAFAGDAGNPVRRLSAVGLGSLFIVCLTTGWQPWNNRFLMVPFTAFSLAIVIAMARSRNAAARPILLAAIVVSGVVLPVFSYNKNPSSLMAAITDRRTFMMRERPSMLEIVNDIEARVKSGELREITLCAGPDSWILPFFSIRGLAVHPAPNFGSIQPPNHEDKTRPQFVLLLDHAEAAAPPLGWTRIRGYAQGGCALFRLDSSR